MKFADLIGHPKAILYAFVGSVALTISGIPFNFSDTWSLVITLLLSVLTFLLLFPLQASQNRDTDAMQKKLDEILRALPEARNDLRGIENDE